MGCSDSRPPVPPRFVAFAWRYHAGGDAFVDRPLAAPDGPRRRPDGPGVFGAGCPCRLSGWRRPGLPGSWKDPNVHMPCSATPVGPHAPGSTSSTARRCCLPNIPHAVGSHDNRPFGAPSHGLHTRCLRFAVRVAPTPRKTRFRLPATLCRAGLAARWVLNVRFRRCFLRWSHRSPPHPGFAWRTG